MKVPRRAIGLLILMVSSSGCGAYFSSLQIVNGTASTVTDLTVNDGRGTWRLDDLPPGGKVDFTGHLAGEGGGRITWTWHNKPFSGDGCYYTGGSPPKGSITITGEKLLYRCK